MKHFLDLSINISTTVADMAKITIRMSHMSIQLTPTLMTLDDLELQ